MTTKANTMPDKGLSRRVLGIFLAPQATFDAVMQSISKADFIIPMILILTVSVGARWVIMPLAYDAQINAVQQNTDLSDDEKDRKYEGLDSWFEKSNEPVSYVIGLAATVAWLVIQAGVLMFMAMIVLGGSGTFWSALVVVCYAQLINVLGGMIKIPLIMYTQSLKVETGFALLLPRSIDSSMLYRFFHRLDLFTIWMIWVMGIGLASMFNVESRRINRLLFGSWAVLMFVLAWLVDGRMAA
ncbi:YIP1 family protein [Candidatus Neomarinimicrobiota bacterium]